MNKSPWKINPEWVAYNNLYNEGAEGFNPHKKWLKVQPATMLTEADYNRLVMHGGLPQPASKLIEALASAEARVTKVTDAFAKEILVDEINSLKTALAKR